MNPRLYLQLLKHNIEHAYEKLILHQGVEHGIHHIAHEKSDYLLDVAVETGPVGFAAEIGSIFTWGRVTAVLAGISSSVNIATAGLAYAWVWSQMPFFIYGPIYDPYSFRDRDPQPLGRMPIRQKTIPESHSNFEFTKIYDVQVNNADLGSRLDHGSYQSADQLIKNNERVEQRERQSEIHFQRAVGFYHNQKFNEAIERANKTIQLKPNYVNSYLLRATAQLNLGRGKGYTKKELDNSMRDADHALRLAPHDNSIIKAAQIINQEAQTELHYLNARELYAQGDFQAALNAINSVYDLRPDAHISGDVFAVRGDCYKELEQYKEALADYEQAAKRNPDTYSSFVDSVRNEFQGNIHLQDSENLLNSQNYKDAITEATKAIQLDPTFASGYLIRAAAQYNLGQDKHSFSIEELDNILQDCKKFLQLASEDDPLIETAKLAYHNVEGDLVYWEAFDLFEQGDFQTALKTINSVFNLHPSAKRLCDYYVLRGDCYNELGRNAEALADYEQAAKLNPDAYTAFVDSVRDDLQFKSHYQEAENLYNKRNYKDAIKEATKAIQSKPNDAMSYLIRAAAQFNLGQDENDYSIDELNNILQDFKQFSQLASQDDPLIEDVKLAYRRAESELLYRKAHDLFSEGNFQTAINTINSLFELNSEAKTCVADAYAVRAHCYYSLQKFTEAFADFDQAASINPDHYSTGVKELRDEYDQWVEQNRKAQEDYNQQVAAYNQQIAAYQQQVAAYNQQVAANNAAAQEEEKRYIRALNMQVSRDIFSSWLDNGNYALSLAKQHQRQADAQHAISMAKFQQQQQAFKDSQDLAMKQMDQRSKQNFQYALDSNKNMYESLKHQARQEMSRSGGSASMVGMFGSRTSQTSNNGNKSCATTWDDVARGVPICVGAPSTINIHKGIGRIK